jgi:predicted RNA-binding Zn-ribbon protein involved in translation (DUF1610 family)
MGRKGIKEYRAPEALALISADRDRGDLICPSCGAATIDRTPKRSSRGNGGQITLHCTSCDRSAIYILRLEDDSILPDS